MSEIITPPIVVKGDLTDMVGQVYAIQDEDDGNQYIFTVTDAYYRPLTRETVLTIVGVVAPEETE